VWWAAGCEVLVDGKLGAVLCQGEGQVGPPACPVGLECRLGTCAPSALGAPCTTDADCTSGDFCLDPSVLGGAGPRRCSRTCCISSDCDPDAQFVCWIPPHGPSSFCRSADEIDRAPGGALGVMASCKVNGDCRSGRCSGGACTDTCCSDTDCAARHGVCRVDGPPRLDALGFGCGPPPGSAGRYMSCQSDADCASGLCVDFGDKRPICSSSCCTSSECETYKSAPVHCVMLGGAHAGLRACGPLPLAATAMGSLPVGVSCTEPGQCRSGSCIASRCSDMCCEDASCGDDPSQFVCRPAQVGGVNGAWALQCEPK
jgi:hypothetical protein